MPLPKTSSRCELWHLFWRWDRVRRLCLAVEDEVNIAHRGSLFCLSKPDGELRQIIDSRLRNSSELPPPKDAPKMGHVSSFLALVIPRDGCLRGYVDDLRNLYHEFVVSTARALSTVVGPKRSSRPGPFSLALQTVIWVSPPEQSKEPPYTTVHTPLLFTRENCRSGRPVASTIPAREEPPCMYNAAIDREQAKERERERRREKRKC